MGNEENNMRVELNIVLKKELANNTNIYNTVDEITMSFNTLFYADSSLPIKHFEKDYDLPVFCSKSLLLTNAFNNQYIESFLCKDLINNKMICNRNESISFIARRNLTIANGYKIDFILKSNYTFRCVAATQGFIFSDFFAKVMGAILKIENDNIVSFDGITFSRYINSDIEDATLNDYVFNYDGLVYYEHYIPHNCPLEDLGLQSMKGEYLTPAKKVNKDNDFRVYYFIFNRRDMVKKLFRR